MHYLPPTRKATCTPVTDAVKMKEFIEKEYVIPSKYAQPLRRE
jgi:hypothetical protein